MREGSAQFTLQGLQGEWGGLQCGNVALQGEDGIRLLIDVDGTVAYKVPLYIHTVRLYSVQMYCTRLCGIALYFQGVLRAFGGLY